MVAHPTHRPDRLTRNECGHGDVSQPNARDRGHVKPRAGASFEPGSVPPSRATVGPQAAESSPAAWVDLTSIGAGAGKITDWSIAGRIGEGQPVPRFGSVARSPLTGRGSDKGRFSFRGWAALFDALRRSAARASDFCSLDPVPGHGAHRRPGLIRNPLFVLPLRDNPRGEVSVEFGGRLAVRLRVAGTAIRCDVLGAPPARGVFQKIKLFVGWLSHARIIGMGDPDDRGSLVQELGSERDDAR